MISDHQLRQDVLDELDFEPRINAAHIGVGVNNGIVTLTGFVLSYAEKLAAEQAIKRVKGVKALAEQIEVRIPSDHRTHDDEIAGRVVDILKWRVGLPASRIEVKVERGIVTLSGEVDWQFQKKDAEAAVHNLTGIAGIANLIRVRAVVQTGVVREKIEKALARSAEVDASRITIRNEGGRVILGGKVHAWHERGLAERAAWSAPGVTEVQDQIQVEA